MVIRSLLWLTSAEMAQVIHRLVQAIVGNPTAAGGQESGPIAVLLVEVEELLKVLVFVLARTARVSGPEMSSEAYRELLVRLLQLQPHSWSPTTLQVV